MRPILAKCVVLGVEGLLCDPFGWATIQSIKAAFAQLNVRLNTPEVVHKLGLPREWHLRALCSQFKPGAFPSVWSAYQRCHRETCDVRLFPAAKEFIRTLHSQGVCTVAVSPSPHAVLDKFASDPDSPKITVCLDESLSTHSQLRAITSHFKQSVFIGSTLAEAKMALRLNGRVFSVIKYSPELMLPGPLRTEALPRVKILKSLEF